MNYKLLETLADIAYIVGRERFYSGNSRGDIQEFIFWAKEFEENYKDYDWELVNSKDYIIAIEDYTKSKLKGLSDLHN